MKVKNQKSLQLFGGNYATLYLQHNQIQTKIKAFVNSLEEKLVNDNVETLTIIGILNGAIQFTIDVAKQFKQIPVQLDFIQISSYGQGFTSGRMEFVKDIKYDINDKHVLLLDDIVSTGKTLSFVVDHLQTKGAKKVITCTLLSNFDEINIFIPDYVLFDIANKNLWVVGYGLDYKGYYRNLLDLYVLYK